MSGAAPEPAPESQTAAADRPRRLIAWLVLANVLVALVLLAMAVLTLRLSQQSLSDRALINTENLAHTIQQNVAASMERVDFGLQTTRLAFENRMRAGRLDEREFNTVLSRIDDLLGAEVHLRIADADGWVRYGLDPAVNPRVNIADRAYFQLARDNVSPSMIISEPLQSRVTGRWTVAMARPLRDRDGGFAGIVYVSFDVIGFQHLFGAVDLGKAGAISLRHANLHLIARQTDRGPTLEGIGTTKVSAELTEALRASPRQGSYMARTALDHVERANAYVRVGAYPLIVIVGQGTDDVLAPWRVQRVQVFALLMLVVLLMAAASVLAYRHWLRGVAGARAAARAQEQQRAAERETQLLRAQIEERDEFVRVLAHEVRQPLNNASAALQSARAVLADSPAASAVAERMHRAEAVIGQIVGTLDNTLAVSALLANPERVQGADADVSLLIALSIGDLDVTARSRVQVDRDSATRTAWMDIGLMRLALRNVLGNALAYSPPTSPVRLRVSDSDEPLGLVFEVFDEGMGVSDELRPRLFERGVRGVQHLSGHGIGLYVVSRVMELHGGGVDVRRNVPVGTVFRLWLPQDR